MGAMLMEQSEKWQTGCKYFEIDLYCQDEKKDSKISVAAWRHIYSTVRVDSEPLVA